MLFGITLLPFNFLHHHAEDEHGMAMLKHEEQDHHCELDEQFCRPELSNDCSHEQHISKTIAKCFSCEFHFIKHFTAQNLVIPGSHAVALRQYLALKSSCDQETLILPGNKGPPFTA